MSATFRSLVGSVLILISTLSIAYVFSHYSRVFGWMDFTSNKRYTLKDGTENILKKVRQKVTAKLFYSKKAVDKIGTDQLKQFNGAYLYVRDLLSAFESASDGKFTLEEYDPENFSAAAEEAAALGVTMQPLPGSLMFAFGLAVTTDTGKKEVIPFINAQEESLFEYKVAELVERATRPSKKKLGVLSSVSVLGDNMSPEMQRMMRTQGRQPNPAWNIAEWLKLDYEVEKVEATATEIPVGLDYLLVIHPKKLTDPTLYAIDQFVMRGGKLVAFVDPFCINEPADTSNQYAQYMQDRSSDLNRLTSAWGAKLEAGRIVGDRNLAYVQQAQKLFPFNVFEKSQGCFNENEVITNSLGESSKVMMLYGGAIKPVDKVEGVDFMPLIETTTQSGLRTFGSMDNAQMGRDMSKYWKPGDPTATSPGEKTGFEEGSERLATAVRLAGKFKSAFPDGLPNAAKETKDDQAAKDKKDEKAAHIKECAESNAVLVFADVDMIGNANGVVSSPRTFFRSGFANQTVLFNAIDYLSGSSDLMGIRSRGNGRRTFTYIEEIRKKAAEKTAEKQTKIQEEIQSYQQKLSALQQAATTKNVGLARADALKQEREANVNIMKLKRELNDVKRASSEKEEEVKDNAWLVNVLGLPVLVTLIGLFLFIVRVMRRRTQIREDMA